MKRIARLTGFEAERHVLSNDPANNDQEGGDEKSDLDTRANRYAHSKIHLVTDSHDNRCDMLGCITNNWNEDQTDECLTDVGVRYYIVDASDEIFGANCHENCGHNQDSGGSDRAHGRLLSLTFIVCTILALGIEEVAVGLELENKVQDVEQEKNNSSSSGQDQYAPVLLLAIAGALVQNGVELGNGQYISFRQTNPTWRKSHAYRCRNNQGGR